MANILNIIARANSLRHETAIDSISPERAGGIMYDTLMYINQMQLQESNPLLISKIYATVAAMQADSAPVSDITGKALRAGQVVCIVPEDPDDPDAGVIYRYNGTTLGVSSWTAVGRIGSDPYLEGYLCMGVATPATDPGVPTQKVYYIATTPGTYENFENLVVNYGEEAYLKFDSAWSKEVTGAATAAQVTELGKEVNAVGAKTSNEVEVGAMDCVIKDDGTFGLSSSYKHGGVAVSPGELYYLLSTISDCLVAFVTTDAVVAGGAIPLVSGTSVMKMSNSNYYYSFKIPAGCSYLIFNTREGVTKCFKSVSLQDKVDTFTDNIPTKNSDNLIKSGGVFQFAENLLGKQWFNKGNYEGRGHFNAAIGEIAVFIASDSWRCVSSPVQPNGKIRVSATMYGNNYASVVFVDKNNAVISNQYAGTTSGAEVPFTAEIDCPQNAVKVYINSRPDMPEVIALLDIEHDINEKSFETIKVLTVNCGSFNYGDSETSLETYQQRWRQMLNDADYDVFGAQDWYKWFDHGVNTIDSQEALIANTVTGIFPERSLNRDYSKLFYRGKCSWIDVNLGGYPYYSHIKQTFISKAVHFFSVYFKSGESSVTDRLAEANSIISKIANEGIEYAVIMGDFNAWSASEFDVWKNAGFKVANCGYLGQMNTLRDIPADNIIVTPNINISKVMVLDDFNLNTDHLPLTAVLKF